VVLWSLTPLCLWQREEAGQCCQGQTTGWTAIPGELLVIVGERSWGWRKCQEKVGADWRRGLPGFGRRWVAALRTKGAQEALQRWSG